MSIESWLLMGGCIVFVTSIGYGLWKLYRRNRMIGSDCTDEFAMIENSGQQRAYTIVRGGNIETENENG